MPRGGRKTVPEGKGPAPVDMSLMLEMIRDIKKDLEEFKDQAKTTRERLDGLQQQMSHLALSEGEQGLKTGERGEHVVTDEGNRGTSSPQQ